MFSQFLIHLSRVAVFICLFSCASLSQQSTGSIRGKVIDPSGALVSGANVIVVNRDGIERRLSTDREGAFSTGNLAPGTYTVRVNALGFAPYEKTDIEVVAGKPTPLDIALAVVIAEEKVTVSDELRVDTDPNSNASATVIKGNDIKALPDDPAELEAALQALAGPGAGPNGGEIFIDGFSGGRMPRRDTIREIRINQNPFSSEFDRLGLGRIEIFTRPGTEDWNGEGGFEFEDESLNSRNPFATNRPPYQFRAIAGELSGPIVKKRASFFVDVDKETIDNNSLINALVLDPTLNVVPFRQAVVVPSKAFEMSPRIDVAISPTHTLVGRYSYDTSSVTNSGLSGFDLPTRAFSSSDSEHLVRLNDTFVINPTTINELRFQYIRRRNQQEGDDTSPIVRVSDAFTAGGANVALAFANEDRFEFQNYTSFIRSDHSIKVGTRLRHNSITDSSPGNFAGTFTFTTMDQYRDTILNEPDARPTQFTIAGGNPQAAVTRTDVAVFVQDDWRIRPWLTLSLGLRYENQTNISSPWNFAPRFGFAYSPGAGGKDPPKTVFRGGFGVFYDRFSENLTLQTIRFDGVNQQQFVVTDETPTEQAILDSIVFTQSGVSNIPTTAQLAAFALKQTTRVVSPTLDPTYLMQAVFSVERQLPYKTTVSATLSRTWTRRMLRSRNINAPIGGVVPDPASGNILQYEATARFDQTQLQINFRSNFREGMSLFGNYALGRAKSDSDGAGTFPRDQYDLTGEYGDATQDIRHRFTVGGSFETFWGLRFNPFVTFRTGVPFNITTGSDLNDDKVFSDRPSFATDLNRMCNFGTAANPEIRSCVRQTPFGDFDLQPIAGQTIIPRNFGRGSSFFNVNLTVSKEIGFGGERKGGDDDDEGESRYNLEFSAQIRNLFNHTNAGNPVGNLSSLLFGRSVALAGGFGGGGGFGGAGGGQSVGNRRIRLEVTFSF